MKGKENREWTMSKHNNDYFKDEKIINDGKKKKKGNEVEISCTNDIVEPNLPNQIFTAMNFLNTHFQGTHNEEAESSTIHY